MSTFARTYQLGARIAYFFLPKKRMRMKEGIGSSENFAYYLKRLGYLNPLVISSKDLYDLGLLECYKGLRKAGLVGHLYLIDRAGEGHIDAAIEAKCRYIELNCDCIVSIGGGSIIDVAKMAGVLVANPSTTPFTVSGKLKVTRRPPYHLAIPTTAGSGSEATVAAVLMSRRGRLIMISPKIRPDLVILDAEMLRKLPPKIVAASGMDALVHATESYLNCFAVPKGRRNSLAAVRLIFNNLMPLYVDPSDGEAGSRMLEASYLAGKAFSDNYVGYAHALAHAMASKVNYPHGYLTALFLPLVLKRYLGKSDHRLAKLYEAAGGRGADNEIQKAEGFILMVEELNRSMGILPLKGKLKEAELQEVAYKAEKEANPLYPTPKMMKKDALLAILKESFEDAGQ